MTTVFGTYTRRGGFQRFVAISAYTPPGQRAEFVEMFRRGALAASIHHQRRPHPRGRTSDRGSLVMGTSRGHAGALGPRRTSRQRIPSPSWFESSSIRWRVCAATTQRRQRSPFESVHRDVSPQNILVGINGTARITDFGVARRPRLSSTRSGQLKGKLAYMARAGARGQIDRRADFCRHSALGSARRQASLQGRGRSRRPTGALRAIEGARHQPRDRARARVVTMKSLDRDPRNASTASAFADELEKAAKASSPACARWPITCRRCSGKTSPRARRCARGSRRRAESHRARRPRHHHRCERRRRVHDLVVGGVDPAQDHFPDAALLGALVGNCTRAPQATRSHLVGRSGGFGRHRRRNLGRTSAA